MAFNYLMLCICLIALVIGQANAQFDRPQNEQWPMNQQMSGQNSHPEPFMNNGNTEWRPNDFSPFDPRQNNQSPASSQGSGQSSAFGQSTFEQRPIVPRSNNQGPMESPKPNGKQVPEPPRPLEPPHLNEQQPMEPRPNSQQAPEPSRPASQLFPEPPNSNNQPANPIHPVGSSSSSNSDKQPVQIHPINQNSNTREIRGRRQSNWKSQFSQSEVDGQWNGKTTSYGQDDYGIHRIVGQIGDIGLEWDRAKRHFGGDREQRNGLGFNTFGYTNQNNKFNNPEWSRFKRHFGDDHVDGSQNNKNSQSLLNTSNRVKPGSQSELNKSGNQRGQNSPGFKSQNNSGFNGQNQRNQLFN